MITITKAVQTCWGCPSQWDAWDAEGRYVYLRYRYGHGTVEVADDIRSSLSGMRLVAEFFAGDPLDGVISLREFCRRANITIAKRAEFG